MKKPAPHNSKTKWPLEKWCLVIGTVIAGLGLIWGIFVWCKPKQEITTLSVTTLAKDYDTKFENMTKKRAQAAIAIQEFLSKGKWNLVTNKTDALDDVLGFFDLIGFDEEKGLLTPDVVHEYFCDDIMAYYQSCRTHILEIQKTDPTAFVHIKPLYETVVKVESEKPPKTSTAEIYFTKQELIKYFQDETNSVNLTEGK